MPREPDLSFRVAAKADAPCLSALAIQVFLDTYASEGIDTWLARQVHLNLSVAAFSEAVERAATTIIVAERRGRLVGFVQLSRGAAHSLFAWREATEIDRLYVQEPFTSRGIGSLLLRRAEALAGAAGAQMLWLTAWVGNLRALRFYAAHGYEDLGATMYEFDSERIENRVFAKALAKGSPAD